ncbi:MAG: hypothetical protein GDA46_05160 [Bdellovibrionales bacterium]|nr:hypothetical protein [Bdellovibrionales bacterium]
MKKNSNSKNLFFQILIFSFFSLVKTPIPHSFNFSFLKLSFNSAQASLACNQSDSIDQLTEKIEKLNTTPPLMKRDLKAKCQNFLKEKQQTINQVPRQTNQQSPPQIPRQTPRQTNQQSPPQAPSQQTTNQVPRQTNQQLPSQAASQQTTTQTSQQTPSQNTNQVLSLQDQLIQQHVCEEVDDLDTIEDKITLWDRFENKELRGSLTNEDQDILNQIKKPNENNYSVISNNKKKCNNLQKTKEEEEEQCKEASKELEEVRSNYNKSCFEFTSGDCEEILKACSVCPSKDESSLEYDCIKTYNVSKCKELSGPDLKEARENIKDYEEKVKNLKEEIEELQKDLTEKENDLQTELMTLEEDFNQNVYDLKNETENAKQSLKDNLDEQKATIKAHLNENIQAVQKAIDSSLKVNHEFENAITTAYSTYKSNVQNINKACFEEALMQLSNFKKRRQKAVLSGAYKMSFSSIWSSKRLSFYEEEQEMLKYYKKSCLKNKQEDFKTAETLYRQTLRQIEQQKEQYKQKVEIMKRNLASLMAVANKEESKAVSSYAQNVSLAINNFEKSYEHNLSNYNKSKQSQIASRGKEISSLNSFLKFKSTELQNLQGALVREQHLKNLLKTKGVVEDEESKDTYTKAATYSIEYEQKKESLKISCNCDSETTNKYCPQETDSKEKTEKEKKGKKGKKRKKKGSR